MITLLYLWSYLVGIPIVGVRESAEYYLKNNHLKQDPSHKLKFRVKAIREYQGNALLRRIDVSRDLLISTILFRKYRTHFTPGNEPYETQRLSLELFGKEVAGVQHIVLLSQFYENRDSSLPISFLNAVLRLKDDKPIYSLGIVRLLQNIAIYFSLVPGNSRIFSGPCSRETKRYMGMQSGIFIERADTYANLIDYLIGKVFFRRAFFRTFSEAVQGENKNTAAYYPHYELGPAVQSKLEEFFQGLNKMSIFGGCFRKYIQGKHEELDSGQREFLEDVIARINSNQLKGSLIPRSTLEKHLSGKVLFEPSYCANFSRERVVYRLVNQSEFGHGFVEDGSVNFENLFLHFLCSDYQSIQRLDFSGLSLHREHVSRLVEILGKNVLQHLTKLDISGTKVDDEMLKMLEPLFCRAHFKCLVLSEADFKKLASDRNESYYHKLAANN